MGFFSYSYHETKLHTWIASANININCSVSLHCFLLHYIKLQLTEKTGQTDCSNCQEPTSFVIRKAFTAEHLRPNFQFQNYSVSFSLGNTSSFGNITSLGSKIFSTIVTVFAMLGITAIHIYLYQYYISIYVRIYAYTQSSSLRDTDRLYE